MCTGMAGRVVQIAGDVAEVETDGRTVRISLVVLDHRPAVGDWLLVHSGIALTVLSEQDAQRIRLVKGEGR